MSTVNLEQMFLDTEGELLLFMFPEGTTLFNLLNLVLTSSQGDKTRQVKDVRDFGFLLLKLSHAKVQNKDLELTPQDVVQLSALVNEYEQPAVPQAGLAAKKLQTIVVYQALEMLEGKPNPFYTEKDEESDEEKLEKLKAFAADALKIAEEFKAKINNKQTPEEPEDETTETQEPKEEENNEHTEEI